MSIVKKFVKADIPLVRRYLVWCFKTTKESLDRIDRKFTQTSVDRYILAKIHGMKLSISSNNEYLNLVQDFMTYVDNKENEGVRQKFLDVKRKEHNPQYCYIQNRLSAVEQAIKYFLGAKELTAINRMYEQEMTRRIIESREHS